MAVRTLIPLLMKRAALFVLRRLPPAAPSPNPKPPSPPLPLPTLSFLVQSHLQAILIHVITAYKTDVSIKAPRD
jgi:hypothetical protein